MIANLEASQSIAKTPEASPANAMFRRWCRFNLVGAIGILVQFVLLFVLKSVFGFHYLAATAIAVELTILHNFVWHERFTWSERTMAERIKVGSLPHASVRRLWRFHLANGTVSLLGNLAVMKFLVSFAHLNFLVANAIAIAFCSLINFFLSDEWVFA